MAVLNILEFPDPRLRTKAQPVAEVNDSLRGLKENVVVGRLIPAGTGLAYHEARKKAAVEEANSDSVSLSDVEAALTEALKEEPQIDA